jgi:hypothetical protein
MLRLRLPNTPRAMFRLARQLATLALLAATPACSHLPPPWAPPAGQAGPYLGRPTGLALSPDGSRLAIAFASLGPVPAGAFWAPETAGFVVVGTNDLGTVAEQDATQGQIGAFALSGDGRRLLAVRRCNVFLGSWGGCGGEDGAYEYRVGEPGHTLLLREERESRGGAESLHAVSYDGAGRAVALAARTCPYPSGERPPCVNFRLLAAHRDGAAGGAPTELGAWEVPAFIGHAPPLFERDGTVRLYGAGNREDRFEVLLRPGEPASVVRSGEGWLRLVGPRSAPGAGGRMILTAEMSGFLRPQPPGGLLLIRPAPGGVPAIWAVSGPGGDINHLVLSADGSRAAFVAAPRDGPNLQPSLFLADVTDADLPQPRRTNLFARLGLGRTAHTTRMTAEELLDRLRALRDAGRVGDPEAVGVTLGLRPVPDRASGAGQSWRFVGELSPGGGGVKLEPRPRVVAERSGVVLELSLGESFGPCVTTEAVRRAFGEPRQPDTRDTGFPHWPSRQPRWTMTYPTADGFVSASFRTAYCARTLSLGQTPRP